MDSLPFQEIGEIVLTKYPNYYSNYSFIVSTSNEVYFSGFLIETFGNDILFICLLSQPPKSKELRLEKTRINPINDKIFQQLHMYEHHRSEFILEITHFDFAVVFFLPIFFWTSKRKWAAVILQILWHPVQQNFFGHDSVVPLQKQP